MRNILRSKYIFFTFITYIHVLSLIFIHRDNYSIKDFIVLILITYANTSFFFEEYCNIHAINIVLWYRSKDLNAIEINVTL